MSINSAAHARPAAAPYGERQAWRGPGKRTVRPHKPRALTLGGRSVREPTPPQHTWTPPPKHTRLVCTHLRQLTGVHARETAACRQASHRALGFVAKGCNQHREGLHFRVADQRLPQHRWRDAVPSTAAAQQQHKSSTTAAPTQQQRNSSTAPAQQRWQEVAEVAQWEQQLYHMQSRQKQCSSQCNPQTPSISSTRRASSNRKADAA